MNEKKFKPMEKFSENIYEKDDTLNENSKIKDESKNRF